MASSFMVMAMMNYGLSKGVIQRNVYMCFVGKDTLGDLPVGQAGMEDSRDGWFLGGLEVLQYKGVGGGG